MNGIATADSRLSCAASAIWESHEYEARDYEMDRSGDCGSLIAQSHQKARIAVLAVYGFTPETYNALLEERLGGDSYAAHRWIDLLSVEPMDEWLDHHTYVETGGELSSLAYLKGN